jgi:hypothetical protein
LCPIACQRTHSSLLGRTRHTPKQNAEKWQQLERPLPSSAGSGTGSSYLGRASPAVEFGGSTRYRRTAIASPPPRWTGGSARGLRKRYQRRKRGIWTWRCRNSWFMGQKTSVRGLHSAERGPQCQEVQVGHPIRPGATVETRRCPAQGGRTRRLLPTEANTLRPGQVTLPNRGTLVPTAGTEQQPVTRTMVVSKFLRPCCNRDMT